MEQTVIDRATFEELKATAGGDFVRELIDTFLEEAPTMLDELRQAFDAGDAELFRRTAHSLKSNGSTFGATTLAGLARDLELGGLEPLRTAAGAPLDTLEREYTRVARALTELKHA
jgi:HPt (histidine-containing phosphotransfer) domain-containing protein